MSSFWENLLGGGTAMAGYASLMDRYGDDRAGVNAGIEDIRTGVEDANFKPWTMRNNQGGGGFNPETGEYTSTLNNASQNASNWQRDQAQANMGMAGGQNSFMGRTNNYLNKGNTNNQAMNSAILQNRGNINEFGQQGQGNLGRGGYNPFAQSGGDMMSQSGRTNRMEGMGMEMAQRSMQDPAARESDVYGRMRAMQMPEEERQMNSMNAGLFGGGRGGMSSGDYGGTPEQFAFGKAQAEARNTASMNAMQQAQSEMSNYNQMGTSMYGQGMDARTQMSNMGMQQYGLGQKDQGMYNQLGMQQLGQGSADQQMYMNQGNSLYGQGMDRQKMYNSMAQNVYGMGQKDQDRYASMGQNQFGNQFEADKMMQQWQKQGLAGNENMSQHNLAQQQMLAELGLGQMGTELNYSNLQGNAFGDMIGGLGAMAGGIGSSIDGTSGGLIDFLKNMF